MYTKHFEIPRSYMSVRLFRSYPAVDEVVVLVPLGLSEGNSCKHLDVEEKGSFYSLESVRSVGDRTVLRRAQPRSKRRILGWTWLHELENESHDSNIFHSTIWIQIP